MGNVARMRGFEDIGLWWLTVVPVINPGMNFAPAANEVIWNQCKR